MEILIIIILILFIYLFYIYGELMKINMNVKEIFSEIYKQILEKIEYSKDIIKIVENDEKLKEIVSNNHIDTNILESKEIDKEEKNESSKLEDTEDAFQNDVIEKHNIYISKINEINILIAEDEKMKDLGIKEDSIKEISELITKINKQKNDMQKQKEEFNKLVNKYNKMIVAFPPRYIAKILGFVKYNNLK